MNRPRPRAGFLPLYLAFYDEVVPGLRGRFSGLIEDVVSILEGSGVDVTNAGIVATAADVSRAFESFADRTDFAVTLHLSYSPSLLVADALEAYGRPIVLLDTTINPTFDFDDPDYLNRNHGIHGVMDLASVLTSRGVRFSVVAGHPQDGAFVDRVAVAVRRAAMAGAFLGQRIGITGAPFPGMGDFSIDFGELYAATSIEVVPVDESRIERAEAAVSDDEVNAVVADDRTRFDCAAVPTRVHAASVRTYLALRAIASEESLYGYTMNFLDIASDRAVPFYACTRLPEDGVGYGGEGDVLTASLARPLEIACGAAMFSEIFCADWLGGSILMAHMGESDLRFCAKDARPVARTRRAMGSDCDSVVFHFPKEPLVVTGVNISPDRGHGFRIVTFAASIVADPVHEQIEHPHFTIRPSLPIARFLERYAELGGGHHLMLARGDVLDDVREMARLLDFAYGTVE